MTKTLTKNAKLSNVESKALLESLLAAQSEAEVDAIIAKTPVMLPASNWLPLDGRDTNWNVTNNQSASGGKAATELVTNMVDAILLRHCVVRGIDPRSPDAPRTSSEAIETFLGWKGGKLSEQFKNQRERTAWAQDNIVIGFSGVKNEPGQPTLTFCDKGEGQHPEDFERTFLSLSAGNKKEIPFVQGKFNMGSSGVISYCGTRKYKLIVSRKHTLDGNWGWTLCRQRPTGELPVIEYLKVGGAKGAIPSFEADSLNPLYTRNGKAYEDVALAYGTAVKLYDFQIGSDFQDFNSPRAVFQEHLADTLLPVRILDLRVSASKNKGKARALGIDGRTFSGLEHLLVGDPAQDETSEDDGVETKSVDTKGMALRFDVGSFDDPELGNVTLRGYFLEEPLTGKSKAAGAIRSKSRVFHCVNGQIQHREQRGFIHDCGFEFLKDHLVLIVDASALKRKTHFEVWKADREMIKMNKITERYLKKIKECVMQCERLKDFNQQVFLDRLNASTSEQATKTIFQKLVASDPNLARLLSGNVPTIAAAQGKIAAVRKDSKPPFAGTFSPALFELAVAESGIELPRGGTAVIKAKTTVNDDYLSREFHPGKVTFSPNLAEAGIELRRSALTGGHMFLTLSAPEDAPLGEMTATFGLFDATMTEPMEKTCLIRVVEAVEEPTPKEKKPRKPKDGQLSLPNLQIVTEDGREVMGTESKQWPNGWDRTDGGIAEVMGDTVFTTINFDNVHLQECFNKAKPEEHEAIWKKYLLAMQVSMIGLERRLKQFNETSSKKLNEETVDEVRRHSAAGFASVAMTFVDTMPKVMAVESV